MYNDIYIASEAMGRMRVDIDRAARAVRQADQERETVAERERLREVERERSREAERQRSREAEQQRMAAERQRSREIEGQRMEAERQRVRYQRRRAAEQKMEEENIKRQTLAPLPAVIDRRADVPLSRYKYNNIPEADAVYSLGDATYKAFLNDAYTGYFIKKRDVNMDKFNEAYYHLICAADSLWAWCHEQIETLAFDSKLIMHRLTLALGMPDELSQFPKSAANYRFMKYYFRAWRKDWFDIKADGSSTEVSAPQSLWVYFKYWFCDFRIGPIICHRAELVATEFEFSSKPAETANKEPSYAGKEYNEIENDLMKLYKYEKCKRKDKKAVVHNDSNQLNDDDNDVIDDNLATAGGDRQALSDESPQTTANTKDHYFGQRDETKVEAVIKDDKSNKGLKAGATEADDGCEYEYSEEEEDDDDDDDDDDDEWNDCNLREDDDDGDDMSISSSLVSINQINLKTLTKK